ncbi:MAG: sulfatase-like hydrolase/transferase [Planctomycetaceae bacterium]|nr:sulfatase-like hydrolase/transferase [Planctomycetaceae bacterium]
MSEQPNILLILTDQQSAQAMSCAENGHLNTPAMDALAAGGVRFDAAYSTYPLCTPARASMFTGLWPHEAGINGNDVGIAESLRQRELGTLLTTAGYRCAYGGKWHVPQIAMGEGHGFETICGFDDNALPSRCEEFLRQPHERPFFLVASFDNPHNICEWYRNQPLPWGNLPEPPAPEQCPPLPDNFAPAADEPWVVSAHRDGFVRSGFIRNDSGDWWRAARWAYYRLIERVDAQIAAIVAALDAGPWAGNTVVIFTSDHGDLCGAHSLGQKWALYDEAVRVPLIIRPPTVSSAGGRTDEHLVTIGAELFRTVCDYAGAAVPDGIAGHSLRPLVEGRAVARPNEFIVSESTLGGCGNSPCRMVRSPRYKYCAYAQGWPREELYDVSNDPGEMVNLAVAASHQTVLREHREMLRRWCVETKDTFCGGHYAHPERPIMLPGDEY